MKSEKDLPVTSAALKDILDYSPGKETKACYECRLEKPLFAFYRTGGRCRECESARSKARREYFNTRAKTPERKQLAAALSKRNHRKKSTEASHRKYLARKDKCPEKLKARNILNNAIAAGRINRGLCFCGEIGQGHHEDYSKPLDVIWLCRKHHDEHHGIF